MKKRIFSIILAIITVLSLMPNVVFAKGDLAIEAENVSVVEGTKIVKVAINVTRNPGVATLGFDVGYNKNFMSVVSFETSGKIFAEDEVDSNLMKNPFIISAYTGKGNKTATGELVTITFELRNNCPAGTYKIKLSENTELGGYYNYDEEELTCDLTSGSITVTKREYGNNSSDDDNDTSSQKPANPPKDEDKEDDKEDIKNDVNKPVKGWIKENGSWYYCNNSGVKVTGWLKDQNTWYYLDNNGVMKTGWIKDHNVWYYLKSSGAMATGWVKDQNTWYYLKSSGAMATGWLKDQNTWYYLKSSGAMATGWQWIADKCYFFHDAGNMAANTTIGGYKLDASGAWVK